MMPRLLLHSNVPSDARNYKGITPLHMTAKSGYELATRILLRARSDPNVEAGDSLKTPLHMAKSSKIVQILLSAGADPRKLMVKQIGKEETGAADKKKTDSAGHKGISAFEALISRNQNAAREVLNSGISSNGKDADSSDLLLNFDLKLFKHASLDDSSRIESLEPEELDNEDLDCLEMHLCKSIVQRGNRELLTHPLSEMFLHLKWKKVQWLFIINFLLCAFFALSFTFLTVLSAKACKGHLNSLANTTYSTDEFGVTDCFQSGPRSLRASCSVFYFTTLILTVFISIREGLQVISMRLGYFRDWENWMELIMVILSFSYLALYSFNLRVCSHLGAFCGFLAWTEFTMLFGRFPTIGIYIFMSFYVLKPILAFLAVYSTTLMSFALAFNLLLPDHEAFSKPTTAIIKVLAMMLGEFDFDSNFVDDGHDEHSAESLITAQLFFVLFYLLVSIVLSNLIVGMTVSKTEELFKQATEIKMVAIAKEIIGVEKLLQTSMLLKRLKKMLGQRIQLFPFMVSQGAQDLKVCVSPYKRKQDSLTRRRFQVQLNKII